MSSSCLFERGHNNLIEGKLFFEFPQKKLFSQPLIGLLAKKDLGEYVDFFMAAQFISNQTWKQQQQQQQQQQQ